jgi:DNA-directed RNA polymerase subunit RPC12/RpoP
MATLDDRLLELFRADLRGMAPGSYLMALECVECGQRIYTKTEDPGEAATVKEYRCSHCVASHEDFERGAD